MCTLPILHASPVHAVASRRGQPPMPGRRGGRRRWSSGCWHQELQRTPQLPGVKRDRCDTELKLSRTSIWGISGGK